MWSNKSAEFGLELGGGGGRLPLLVPHVPPPWHAWISLSPAHLYNATRSVLVFSVRMRDGGGKRVVNGFKNIFLISYGADGWRPMTRGPMTFQINRICAVQRSEYPAVESSL